MSLAHVIDQMKEQLKRLDLAIMVLEYDGSKKGRRPAVLAQLFADAVPRARLGRPPGAKNKNKIEPINRSQRHRRALSRVRKKRAPARGAAAVAVPGWQPD
jgi:hypothetical protein